MGFADALDRETAWLRITTDALPTLLGPDGPFKLIQARRPRIPSTRMTSIFVLRAPGNSGRVQRFAAQRTRFTTRFQLQLLWPLSSGTGSAETDQLAFEQAIDLTLARVQDLLGDHTHGGRFLSVAENPEYIDIDYTDPERGMADGGVFTATITYSGDDPDYNN